MTVRVVSMGYRSLAPSEGNLYKTVCMPIFGTYKGYPFKALGVTWYHLEPKNDKKT